MMDGVWDKVVCRRLRGHTCGVGPCTIIKEVAHSQACFREDGQLAGHRAAGRAAVRIVFTGERTNLGAGAQGRTA